jgi:chloride channel protein, CIC family
MHRNLSRALPSEPPRPQLGDFSTNRRVLLLCLLALPIGAIAAVVAKALLWLIAVITNLAFFHVLSSAPSTPANHHLGLWMVAVPVAGSLVVGLMARYGSEKIRGHGIPEALEAILLGRSLIDPKVALLKPISSAVSIGTGGPFGAEGPIIMTGGALGSLFAQFFHLTAAERKTLLVAGAAGGMAAIFATPVAAVLLAVELLLFEWKPRSFLPVTVAATVAAVTRVPLLGAGPIFRVAAHPALPPQALAVAVAVGMVVGLASGALTRLVYGCEDLFERLPLHWMWWPALGGLAVGIGGLIDPRVLGVGYDLIHQLVEGRLLGATLVVLLVAKATVWAVALGSGTSGGVLAPLLMIGGAIGALFGNGLGAGDPGLWAMIGMAAMVAGAMRAPFTGMVFVLEVTHDLNALPALMAGCAAATCVTVLLLRRSILTEKLARRGQHIACEYSVDPFEFTRVFEVMDKAPPTAEATMTVQQLAERIGITGSAGASRHGTVLLDADGLLCGIVTRRDIMEVVQAGTASTTTARAAGTIDVAVTFPDETLRQAIATMLARDVGRLPVVDRDHPGRVVGYLGRADVLKARSRLQEEEEERQLGPFGANLRGIPGTRPG